MSDKLHYVKFPLAGSADVANSRSITTRNGGKSICTASHTMIS